MKYKFIIAAALVAATVRCEDAATEISGPYVPPQVKGDDGRRLIWEPEPNAPKQPYEPDFSPDGMKVVVSYRNGIFGRDADVAILDLTTRELKVIIEGNSAKRPQWSPTGEWIAYESQHPGHSRTLWVVRPDGTDNHMVDLGNYARYVPHWGPAGDRIYFVGHYDSAREQVAVDAYPGKRVHLALAQVLGPTFYEVIELVLRRLV